MIAIIIAAAENPRLHGLDEHLPLSLFPLGDRPILHHIVEYLASQGIRRFEFLSSYLPEKIETYFGDGTRWGCSFRFHLVPCSAKPYRMVETIAAGIDDEVVLAVGDRLPEVDVSAVTRPTMFFTDSGAWTGWAVLPKRASLAGLVEDPSGGLLVSHCGFEAMTVPLKVNFEDGPAMLRSQRNLLSGVLPGLMISGRQSEPGIWISRNVSLHHTASLVGPLYIGQNCKISRGAQVGPSAVVCENCIIDEHSSVANSIVAPGTYVGQGLELDEVIVDRNRLLNVKFDSASLVSDTFLLSGLTERRKGRHLLRLTSIMLAFALLIITSLPAVLLLLHLLIGRKGKLTRAPAVSIPAGSNEREWREYQYPLFQLNADSTNWPLAADAVDFWMSLLSVVNGDLFLVGLKPRSQREINALPDDWRSIYLKSKAGVITEATVRFGESPNDDELYSAEACYSATESLAHDLKLTWLYIWKAVASLAQRNSTSLTRPGADSA